MAKTPLPNLVDLAKKVIEKLGATENCRARQELERHKNNVEGISIDRIFGLLERDFFVEDIEEAVAAALRPPTNPDITAHKTLVDLSTADGEIRLVTTNFDLLFEACDDKLSSSSPPRLPKPGDDDFRGIIHLHGRVNRDYNATDGNGFVVSSGDFGRAYLSEAWATNFIKALMRRFLIVFVGYTARRALLFATCLKL